MVFQTLLVSVPIGHFSCFVNKDRGEDLVPWTVVGHGGPSQEVIEERRVNLGHFWFRRFIKQSIQECRVDLRL